MTPSALDGHQLAKLTKMCLVSGLLNSDRLMSVWVIVETLYIPKTTAHNIISNNLHVRKECAKWVLKLLLSIKSPSDDYEWILKSVQNEPDLLDSVITSNETRELKYNLVTKRQSFRWYISEFLHPNKTIMNKPKMKITLNVFFVPQRILIPRVDAEIFLT